MTSIKGFGKDATIVHIGDFFRYNNVPEWSIAVWCWPTQDKKHARLSNLPLLSRGKLPNSQKKQSRRIDRVITFEPGYKLIEAKLADFPEISSFKSIRDKDGIQNAFCCWGNKDDWIVIPQLELARAIFLVNSYLCRACLSSATLPLEFDVQPVPEQNHVNIHVLQTSTFPKSAFDQSGTKQLLAWLLTDPQALASYQSIFQRYQETREFRDRLESWRFSFTPPTMTNWKLHVRGRYNTGKNHYLVEEIVGIDFDVNLPESVAFIHPDFVNNKQTDSKARSGSGGTAWQQTDEEFEIDDEQSASDENETLMLEGDLTWCRFTKPSRVYKQEVVKERPNLIFDELAEKEAGRDVSTGESHQGGSLPAADVGGKEDVTDRERQFASRFKSFDRMLQVLKFKHKCRILHEETLPLPKVGRSKQHLLENGTQRAIKAVRLRYMQTDVVLLEVDTSDGIKMLSTKVIFGSDARDWIEHFTLIRKGVVAKSISWPNELLDGLFGENCHIGINHPKHQGAEAGNIPVESIESWAQRFTQCLSH